MNRNLTLFSMHYSNREGWIDWAKAIGILLVVMGHSEYSNPNVRPMIFMIHMPLFFVVSGYLFNAQKTLSNITRSNIKGLLIPYVLYNLLFAAYWLMFGIFKVIMEQEYSWVNCLLTPGWHCVLGIALDNYDGPTWFLLALIWCKYFAYFMYRGYWFLKVLLVIVWAILLYIRIETGVHYIYALDCACAGIIWFEIGQLLRIYKDKVHIPSFIYYVGIPIGFALCYYIMLNNGMCNYILANVNGLCGIAGTACGLVAFFSLCKLLERYNNSLIELVSKASIVIMCLHMMINNPLNNLLHYWNHSFYTFSIDCTVVLVLSSLYPFIQKNAPLFVGGRK